MHLIHAKEKKCGNIFSSELGLVWIITFKLCVKFGWHLSSKFTLCRKSYDDKSNLKQTKCSPEKPTLKINLLAQMS